MQTSSAARHSADLRMKAEDCPLGDADSAARDRAQDESASTKTGTIDDDPLSGLARRCKNTEKRKCVTWTV
jgi:hypothetical protein